MREKKRGETCYSVAVAILEYMDGCARNGMTPLRHDVNAYRMRLNKARNRGLTR